MELFSNLTDDQLALLGCFAAIVVSATIMSLSYYIGPASKTVSTPRTLPHVERIKQQSQPHTSERRAA